MNEKALEYIAGIKRQLSQQPTVTTDTRIVRRVLELGKTLTTLSRPGAVDDPVARTDMRERALHLAVGIIVGPDEDKEQSERVLTAIQPEVAGRVREYLIVTAGSLEKKRMPQA